MRYSSPPVDAAPRSASPSASFAASSGINPNPYGAPASGPSQRGPAGYANPHGVQGYGNMGAMGHAPGAAAGQDGFGGWGSMNDATAQMGVQFGKSAVAAGQDYVEKNVSFTALWGV
jgi:hypothetical protein